MQNDRVTPRASDRNQRTVEYRPLRPGQDFQRATRPVAIPVAPPTPPTPQPVAVVKPVIPVVPAPIQPTRPVPPVIPAVLPEAKPPVALPVKKEDKMKRKFSLGFAIAIVAVVSILGVTGYIAYDTWRTNNEAKDKVAQISSDAAVLGEGQDESDVAESAVDNYQVAAGLPRVLTIESLNIRSRILPMSVNAKGAVQAPVNIFDSGWYTGSAKPGTEGAALIDGHASGATREGLFAYLDKLSTGDKISVERGDRKVFTYKVVHMETVFLKDVDMGKLLKPYSGVKEGLNLITCSGTWLPDENTYDMRVLVYTERI